MHITSIYFYHWFLNRQLLFQFNNLEFAAFNFITKMTLVTECLIFGAITVLIAYLLSQRQPNNFPPGPWGFPILGHLPLLGIEAHKKVIEWKNSYGPIIGMNFGSFRCVVISDYKLVKEAMNQQMFAGRPNLPFVMDRSFGKPEGIVFTEGRVWQEQRRFALRHLRDFGFGTKSMEVIVQDEVRELIERFKAEIGQPISTSNRFNVAVVNALWTIITGERFKQDDPELNKIIKLITTNITDNNMLGMLSNFIPWIAKYGPNFLTCYRDYFSSIQPTIDFIQPYIDHHFKSHAVNNPRDFIDTYIDEMKSTTDLNSSFHIDKKMTLMFTILDLFIAGAETTSTTLSWIFLYMAKYPQIQAKLASEILSVVGNSRLPSLNDRKQMPYTEAVIHEIMRSSTLAPMSLMHSTAENVQFHGYDIPKDTMVLINLYEAHHNVEYWGDPAEFRPERFLSADRKEFVKHEAFMSFSSGKRVCLGETLARDELFLFTSALFQVFKVSVDPSNPDPTLEPHVGTVLLPQKHALVLNLRED